MIIKMVYDLNIYINFMFINGSICIKIKATFLKHLRLSFEFKGYPQAKMCNQKSIQKLRDMHVI